MEIIQGAICGIVYQNYENGYSVLRLSVSAGQTITVVGTIPLPSIGERLMVTGRWSSHPSYGKQFEAEFLERLMPETDAEIIGYLSSRIIKGIGPKLATRIVARFGNQTLMIMDKEPERLAEVSGISAAKAQAIGDAFRAQVGIRHLMEFFSLHQLPAELAVRTYKVYGNSAIELLYDDPYLLMDDGLDAPFGAVDHFAIELGVDGNDPKRLEAGIIFELRYNLSAGHSFLPADKLIAATAQLLSVEAYVVSDAVSRLIETERLIRDELANISVIYLPEIYQAEKYCSHRLQIAACNRFTVPKNIDSVIHQSETDQSVQYSEQQALALQRVADTGLLLITGGPGTGKTTILRGVLSVFKSIGLRCVMAAPTGRAAKRLSEVTGTDASTIHRLLGAGIDPQSGKLVFGFDENNPLKVDAVIVDEMSMVDIQLLYALLQAVPAKARLIFVGDPDQLPPVGPGSPFSDMLRSNILPSVRLTEIFRQAQESLIVTNAHRVNRGEMPILRDVKHDFFFLPVRSEDAVGQTIATLCTQRLPQNMGIPTDQIQVLSPTKRGGAGTVHLNALLQAQINPQSNTKKQKQYGDYAFRVGDRIMQIRNNYDIMWKSIDSASVGSGVFNGDVGTITDIDFDMEQISVMFDDKIVDYDFTQLNELEPAFAMTVHKSQGSEYRAVVLAAWNSSGYLLNRSILYTAITRARELLVIVGREDTIAAMTNNAKVNRRYTGLKLRLQNKDT